MPEGGFVGDAAPNRPPAAFGAPAPLCCPNMEPVLPVGVLAFAAVAPPTFPKLKDGVPLPRPAAEPKMEPDAGAAVAAVLDEAPADEEPGVPNWNSMLFSGRFGSCSAAVQLLDRDARRGTEELGELSASQHVPSQGRCVGEDAAAR